MRIVLDGMKRRFGLSFLTSIFALCLMALMFAMPTAALAISAPPDWSATYLYNAADKTSTPVITKSFGTIRNPLHLKLNLDVDVFTGIKRELPLFGTWVSYRWAAAENVALKFGPAITYENSRFRSPGVIVGIQFRL